MNSQTPLTAISTTFDKTSRLAGIADHSVYWISGLKAFKRNLSCVYLPPDARIAEEFCWS